jgi:hypothetical protein
MSDDMKDPAWRHQYDAMPRPDPQFEEAVAGAPVLRMAPVSAPLSVIQPWLAPLHK